MILETIFEEISLANSEIEDMFCMYGGNRTALEKRARILAKTTTMTLKEAVSKVIFEDQQKRVPVGIISDHRCGGNVKKKITPKYMMATKAIHKLGDISRDNPDLCRIVEEDDENYPAFQLKVD